MRLATVVLFAALLAAPLAAQTGPTGYAVFASQDDLADGGTLPGAVPSCIVVMSPPGPTAVVLFFDATSGALATFDEGAAPGARTTVVATAAELEAAAGAPVTVCRDAVAGIGSVPQLPYPVFLAVADAGDADRVLRLDASGALTRLTDPANTTDAGDGVSGLATFEGFAFYASGLYLARVAALGAPEDGIYRLDLDGADQTPTAIVTDPDLDLVGLAITPIDLIAVSSKLGGGNFQNAVLSTRLDRDPVTLGVYDRPCEGSNPVFTDCTDGGLGAVEILYVFAGDSFGDVPLVLNNSSSGPDGETAAPISFDNNAVFTESGLVNATGIAGFTPAGRNGTLAFAYPEFFFSGGLAPRLLLAGSDAFGGTPGLYTVGAPFGVAGESAPGDAGLGLTVGPNPSRSVARVTLTLASPSAVRVALVDALGRTVQTLHDGDAAGEVSLRLDTSGLAVGVYRVVATSDGERASTALTVAS